jgi:outer membrane protein assembly factor BamC
MMAHRLFLTGLLLPAFMLGGCTWTRDLVKGDKLDYKSEKTQTEAPTLEVPPDLTRPDVNKRFATPALEGGNGKTPVLASDQTVRQAPQAALPVVLPPVKNARIERGGSQRWLVITGKPDQYWDAVKEFWQDRGFIIATEKPEAGVMETDWAENRAKLGGDFLRNTLGRVLPGIYSTPERDKFRTRFETNANGETEIFISHRGMIEIYKNEAREQTIWQPREPDPGLEAEFLSLLMVRLGTGNDEKGARQLVAGAPKPPEKAVMRNDIVELEETFDRAWRRVGLALDRVGFTVEDRDRSKGLFFVRYADPDAGMNKKADGFMGKIIGMVNPDKTVPAEQYQIQVTDGAATTRVQVLSKTGVPENSQTSRRILSLLQEQLR